MSRKADPAWRRFGREIQALRKKAGLTQAQAADAVGVSPSFYSAWENGTRAVHGGHAQALDRLFNTTGVVTRLLAKATETDALPQWYEEVEELERAVSELREYQPSIIPGLIQTEEYTRALLKDSAPWATKQEVERMVESRSQRRRILDKEDPPLVTMVLETSVIKRVIGGKHVLSAQLGRMLHLIDAEVVRIQLMPPDAGCHPGGSGPFRTYTFPDKPLVASAEYMWGEELTDELLHVQQCVTIFGILQGEALSPRASRDLIRKVKEELDDDEA